jgi:hypothetical protein
MTLAEAQHHLAQAANSSEQAQIDLDKAFANYQRAPLRDKARRYLAWKAAASNAEQAALAAAEAGRVLNEIRATA